VPLNLGRSMQDNRTWWKHVVTCADIWDVDWWRSLKSSMIRIEKKTHMLNWFQITLMCYANKFSEKYEWFCTFNLSSELNFCIAVPLALWTRENFFQSSLSAVMRIWIRDGVKLMEPTLIKFSYKWAIKFFKCKLLL